MNPPARYTLGIAALVLASAAPVAVTAQSASPTACSVIDAEELKRVTGLRDVLRRGPVPADPSELPKGITECEYLGLSFSMTSGMTGANFDRNRQEQEKSGTKTEPVTGVGEQAYYWWDPRPGSYRQAGIAFRSGSYRLVIMDLTSADSLQSTKATLLKAAQHTAPKLR